MKFDCFTFYNEWEVLEMRLEELYPVVDKFIIVEGDKTFAGAPKDTPIFNGGWDHSKWADKIISFKVMLDDNVSAWDREFAQRNGIGKAFGMWNNFPKPEDWILVSDVDEIPRREVVEKLGTDYNDWAYTIDLPAYYGGLNVFGGHYHSAKAVKYMYFDGAQRLRQNDIPNHIPNGGWHFSYLGDEEFIANKIRSYAHTELNTAENTNLDVISDRLATQQNLWGTGEFNTIVPIDDTWPEAVKRDPDRWAKYVWQA